MRPQGADLDYLDTKFEQFWQGDEVKEREHILAVATVIRSFVEKSAVTRATWFDDYVKLRGDLSHGAQLAKKDQERLAAYAAVFDDLPARSNRQFATRDVHRKTHGCFKARITIHADLDPAYQQGVFMPGKEYNAVVRFSNGNPRNNSDYASDARGMDETLSSGDFVMSLKIQPFDNPEDTPIKDSTQIWHSSEEERDRWLDDLGALPLVFRKRKADTRKCIAPADLATIRITRAGGQTNNFTTCEDLSFNPWNNVLSAHKPLGIIQRVRRAAYNASRSSRFRISEIPPHLE